MEQKTVSFFGIFVWTLAILFFFYEFFLRIFIGTIATGVMRDLHLTIRQFSIVGSAYYLVYGLMQVPVGILTEKIGTRIILTLAALVCTIGVFWFALAHSFYPALFSRLLIGFGSSFAFVSLLILSLNWFPKKYFAFLCGFSLFLGAVGPILAGAPLAYVYKVVDGNWRLILFWIGIFGSILTLFLGIFMRTKSKVEEQTVIFITPYEPLYKKLLQLFFNAQAWCVLLFSSLLYCPLPLLGAYFGTSYLETRGFEKTKAAFLVSLIWVGYAVGNPIIGKLSDLIKRRTPFLILFALIGCLATIYLLYFSSNNYWILLGLFFLIGLASSSQGLAYALIVEHTPKKLHSAALGLNNAAGMLFGAIIPPIAGFIIQMALRLSGKVTLTQTEYVEGLSLLPILYGLGTVLAIFFIKETFCRPQHEIYKLAPLHRASDLL